jgi:hypothetical protein
MRRCRVAQAHTLEKRWRQRDQCRCLAQEHTLCSWWGQRERRPGLQHAALRMRFLGLSADAELQKKEKQLETTVQ